jgi:hypothetical protein
MYPPRIYLYKITFEEVAYYYYGIKKERFFNEEYWGSSVTHKWCWDFYTPKKQILELFDFSDKGWLEAQEVEKRIITPVLNDKWCLNENVGGIISIKLCKEGGKKGYKNGILKSKHLLSDYGKKGGKIAGEKNKQNKIGVCGLSYEERSLNGKKLKENKIGIHNLSSEQLSTAGKKGYANGLGKLSKKERSENYRKIHLKKHQYIFTLTSPDGEIIETIYLSDICKKFNLNRDCLSRVSRGERSHHKGWKITRRLKDVSK